MNPGFTSLNDMRKRGHEEDKGNKGKPLQPVTGCCDGTCDIACDSFSGISQKITKLLDADWVLSNHNRVIAPRRSGSNADATA